MATLADIFVVAGAADSVCQVFVAAEARWGIASTAAKAARFADFGSGFSWFVLGWGGFLLCARAKTFTRPIPISGWTSPLGQGLAGFLHSDFILGWLCRSRWSPDR